MKCLFLSEFSVIEEATDVVIVSPKFFPEEKLNISENLKAIILL